VETAENLTITHDAAGNPILNIPQEVASSLAAGQSLPKISLLFGDSANKHFDFDTEVFMDPLAI